MSLSSSDSVISTCGGVLAIGALAIVESLVRIEPAGEAWVVGKDVGHSVPPFPVVVDFVMEPDVCTSSDSDISSPGGVEVRLNHSVGCIHISLGRDWNL